MTETAKVYPIWVIECTKQLIKTKERNQFKEMTQNFVIKINGLRKTETKLQRSPHLLCKLLDNNLWVLTLDPRVRQPDSVDYFLGVFLHMKTKPFESFRGQMIKFEITLIHTKSGKSFTKRSKNLFFTSGCGYGWKYFIKRDDIFEKCLRSHDLKVCLSITTIQPKFSEIEDRDVNALSSGDCNRLDTSFNFLHDFMNDREFTDTSILVEDMHFEVHSKLLAQKSPVFMSLISNQKEISMTGVEGMDVIVFYEFISFLYKGYAPNVDKHCKQLLIVANYYKIQDLKSICDNLCYRHLTPEEAIDALTFAIKYQALSTRIRAQCYIADNLDQVIESSEEKWQQLLNENEVIVKEIMEIKEMMFK